MARPSIRFAELLLERGSAHGLRVGGVHDPEPLAQLDYGDELRLKREALAKWWRLASLPGTPDPIVAAPKPRGYRSTTKRRVHIGGDGAVLGFPGGRARIGDAPSSLLDLPEHQALYSLLAAVLRSPGQRALAEQLTWVIVRGEGEALALVLNLRRFDAAVVRAAKRLGDVLRQQLPGVRALLLYLDPTGSDYYLEVKRPTQGLSLKRIFGPENLSMRVDGVRLDYPAISFSQVNAAMVPSLVASARELLGPIEGDSLLDLYCGYGLLGLTLGATAREIVGVDHDGPAIEAARLNARRLGRSARFVTGAIDAELIGERLPRPRAAELVLLDPPRLGTAPGVAAAVAQREPSRVLHICCGIDELPREVSGWKASGLTVERVIPLDLFAGTAGIETLILLRSRQQTSPSRVIT